MATGAYDNGKGSAYPLTKMNFLVTVDTIAGTAAFSEVTGIESTVDVIEFRQGGNITLKMGYVISSPFKTWVMDCVSEMRGQIPRQNVTIELIDINAGAPTQTVESSVGPRQWTLTNAFVVKYSAPDLDAKNSDIAIESVEIAYEELIIPN